MNADLLLSVLLQGYLLARRADGYSPGALTQYEWAIERLIFVVGDKPIHQVTIEDLRRFMSWMQTDYVTKGGKPGKLSPVSIFHAWKALHAFYAWLNTEYQVERIERKLAKPKFQYPEIKPFSEDEIKAIVKAAEYSRLAQTEKRLSYRMPRPTARRDLAIVILLLDTGIRIGEMSRLLVSDANLDSGEIVIRPFRSGIKSRARTVPIGARTRKVLWKYLALRDLKNDDHYLFVTVDDHQLVPNAAQHVLRSIGKAAGVLDVHPHRFRHTFAIEYLRNGGDVFTLKKILGHTTLKTVEHYLSLVQADVTTAHRRASPADHWKL